MNSLRLLRLYWRLKKPLAVYYVTTLPVVRLPCPAQTDPGKFIRSIYFRNFKGAAETIRENNALGAVCARVCPTERLLPKRLSVAGVDAPIDIGRLQRFVTDFEQQIGMEIYQPGTKTLGKVAIIGAGPAGLQASVTLTNQGYRHDL